MNRFDHHIGFSPYLSQLLLLGYFLEAVKDTPCSEVTGLSLKENAPSA